MQSIKDTYDPPAISDALSRVSAKAAEYLEQTDPPAQTSFDDWQSPFGSETIEEMERNNLKSQQARAECSRRPIGYDTYGNIIYGNTPTPKKPEAVDKQKPLLPIITRGDLVPDKPIKFLWKDRFPYEFGIVAGRQGLGKSMFVGYLASQITNSNVVQWGDGAPCPSGSVLLFTPEGGSSLTIQRIRNMGGNVRNIVFYSGLGSGRLRPDGAIDIDLDPVVSDIDNLKAAIDAAEKSTGQKVCLIVIDPLADYLGEVRQNDNAEVTRALRGLDYLAVERNICIIGVKHLNKNANTSAAVYSIGGSNAFSSKARFVYLLDQHPESRKAEIEGDCSIERRLILSGAKSNDFNIKHSIEYQLAGEDNIHVVITDLYGDWTADSLQFELSQINGGSSKGRGRPADEERNAEIRNLLASGKSVAEVMEIMKQSGRRVGKTLVYDIFDEVKKQYAEGYSDFGDDDD